MLKIQEVGAVLVDMRNEAVAAQGKGEFFIDGYMVEAEQLAHITFHCLKHLAQGNVKQFVRYIQAQSGPCTGEFDYIVQGLFDRLHVKASYRAADDVCWEDFEEQFLSDKVAK